MSSPDFPIVEAGLSGAVSRNSAAVILVGFQEQDNLGLGYLASTLRRCGHRVSVFDFEEDHQQILQAAWSLQPVVIGFSLIFQFYVERFRALMCFLRQHGVAGHFTMGGHFPSLSYEQTLELIPELDSVVRFEGEQTLLELVDVIAAGEDWRAIRGIAWRDGGQVVATPLRPLIEDLDRLPYPERNAAPKAVLGRKVAAMLASRGCARTCSFCSIHVFYRTAPGKVVRTRRPAEVAREMRVLHEERGITIFLFQDDDFPLFGPVWRRWAGEFLVELHRNNLPGRVIWKINCRADVVDSELFTRMREAGLYLVYMGLESGSEEGLNTLHKQISVEQNVRAVELLKSLDILFQYGFMMFDPSTTFESVLDNVRFLRRIVGDGSAGATFCRMIPYDGTPIKDQLLAEGRFRGDVTNPDYDFLDARVERYYEALSDLLNYSGWVHGHRALTPLLDFIWHEVAVMKRAFPPLAGMNEYQAALSGVTRASNELLFRVVEDISYTYSWGRPHDWTPDALQERCQAFMARVMEERNAFVARNQKVLLEAIGQPEEAGGARMVA